MASESPHRPSRRAGAQPGLFGLLTGLAGGVLRLAALLLAGLLALGAMLVGAFVTLVLLGWALLRGRRLARGGWTVYRGRPVPPQQSPASAGRPEVIDIEVREVPDAPNRRDPR